MHDRDHARRILLILLAKGRRTVPDGGMPEGLPSDRRVADRIGTVSPPPPASPPDGERTDR